ncbi:hypothetical protein FACS1894166_02610 [Bacilli bacterium]|nr:hypothetical protein FACS1894166_02610 [Bacilli bacterium]
MDIKKLDLKEIMRKEVKDPKVTVAFRMKRSELNWVKTSAKIYGITPSFFLERLFTAIHKQQIETKKKV